MAKTLDESAAAVFLESMNGNRIRYCHWPRVPKTNRAVASFSFCAARKHMSLILNNCLCGLQDLGSAVKVVLKCEICHTKARTDYLKLAFLDVGWRHVVER